MSLRLAAVFAAALSFVAAEANAGLTFYTDRTAWETALGGTISTENFNGVTPYVLSGAVSNPAGLLSIELSEPSSSIEIVDGSQALNVDGTTFLRVLTTSVGVESIRIDLPGAVFGFGADFFETLSNGGASIEINGLSEDFENILTGIGTGFVGVISTDAFTSVRLFDAQRAENFGVDNVSFGEAAVVTEPAALTLIGLGALGLLLRRRRA